MERGEDWGLSLLMEAKLDGQVARGWPAKGEGGLWRRYAEAPRRLERKNL